MTYLKRKIKSMNNLKKYSASKSNTVAVIFSNFL